LTDSLNFTVSDGASADGFSTTSAVATKIYTFNAGNNGNTSTNPLYGHASEDIRPYNISYLPLISY